MKEQNRHFKNFSDWQVGYGAFTYDISHKESLIEYVKRQNTHHAKVSFKEELIDLLEKFEIDYDERY